MLNIWRRQARNIVVSLEVKRQRAHEHRDHRGKTQQEPHGAPPPVKTDPQREQEHRIVDRAEGQTHHRPGK
jgi:hypothetical protein